MNKVGKKIQKILIVLIFIMGIAIFLLNKYVLQEMPIAERIGTATETSVTIEESLHIKTYSTTKYFSLLSDGEYEKAYQMLTDEYKAYMPYEQYLEKEILGTDIATVINKAVDDNEKAFIKKDDENRYIQNDTNSINIEVLFYIISFRVNVI